MARAAKSCQRLPGFEIANCFTKTLAGFAEFGFNSSCFDREIAQFVKRMLDITACDHFIDLLSQSTITTDNLIFFAKKG